MKRPLFIILISTALLFGQGISNERLFLDIDTDITDELPGRNPAFLHGDNAPFRYVFSYRMRHEGGDDRLPFTPALKFYQGLSTSAYTEMKNGMFFAGRFSYRYEERHDKLFLHNAENYLDIPFYFADSSLGNFNLNGIDWNVILSYPLSERWRAAVDIFYNVDEQFKTVFPKPNVKRNDVHLRPALAYQGKSLQWGISGSFFRYRELMNTRKYVLEQHKSPVFMRIRGLDKPLITHAQTSEERLQSIAGTGISANLDLSGILLLESFYESANANIADGGAYPEAQGSWNFKRYSWRIALQKRGPRSGIAELFLGQEIRQSTGFHPTLNRRIYDSYYRSMESGFSLPYHSKSGHFLRLKASYQIEDYKREDNFFGLLQYVPDQKMNLEFCYGKKGKKADFEMKLSFAQDFHAGDELVYADIFGDYYEKISALELDYLLKDRSEIGAELMLAFPLYARRLLIRGCYTQILVWGSPTSFHYAGSGISYIF